ncbi:MAG: TetR/AcrR family transcriptional regulator [Gammaproteobacteria bacterium]|nr:TetR/AcrR family transcriptional regulator [Gammaproteobacteria bacterium]MBU1725457.1 TetR/AcrR family transcriptional regulator [Gammaproteobacteria bacterium]MBU2005806.1 TetR/AcrR family transcriptional regulator [Gammaproteobacteria bacterium]
MVENEKPEKKRKGVYHHGNLRVALVLETEQMLAANELDQITLIELGKRLGVARTAPYRHFASKSELLCEVATRAFARLTAQDRAIRLEAGLNPIGRLRKLARHYFHFAVNNRDYYRLMYRENLVGNNESTELAAAREENFAEFVWLLEECQQAGLIDTADLETQALFCWAPFHGICSLIIDQHLPEDMFADTLDWHIDAVLRGLGFHQP